MTAYQEEEVRSESLCRMYWKGNGKKQKSYQVVVILHFSSGPFICLKLLRLNVLFSSNRRHKKELFHW